MKEITLKIPDNSFPFFMQLMQKLGYVKIDKDVKRIPEHHKKIIRERLKKTGKIKDGINLQKLLLSGPEMTEEQLNYVQEKKKHFNEWK